MKPAPFNYFAPKSLEEALALLTQYGDDAKLLAGGQSLIPVMNFRLAQPETIIDLNKLSALDYITKDAGCLRIGALVRHSRLESDGLIAEFAPLVHEAMPLVAHSQVRNRGTIGGSLAHADPAAELPVLMVALGASFKLQRQAGVRWVEADDFFVALFETALQDDEILTEVKIPFLANNTGVAFQELARRQGDFAQAGVAVVVTLDAAGVCEKAMIVFLNVGDRPIIARGAMQQLVGQRLDDGLIETAATFAAQNEIDPEGDIHATAAYKRHLAKILAQRT
ncbi:MAG TPA: xanthine dehydrogenase family protein subunit M, partial [Anaerolineae bacterium]|nr:xanthine dehydrogenase family protein subunit M [Anaerolineae bacterium]